MDKFKADPVTWLTYLAGQMALLKGIFVNFVREGVIASTGTMSMNSYYLLACALFLCAIASKQLNKD